MKALVFITLFFSFLLANVQTKSYIGFEYKSYLKKPKERIDSNSAIIFQSQIEFEDDNWKIFTLLDILKDTKEKQRDYINLNELYFSKSFDNFDFYIGKKVNFLGSLEGYNLVDIFNRQNYQKDFLSEYKKGSNQVAFKYFFEDDSNLNFHVKFLEDDIKMPNKNSPYYAFSSLDYSEKIKFATKDEEPSFLLNYLKSIDDNIVADSAFGVFYGYDENILYDEKDMKINPFLFKSAKLFTYGTFVLEDILMKFEASYTKVIEDKDFNIDNFYSLGTGLEYIIEGIYKNHNLGIISEYYKNNNELINFNNDFFLALRYSLNDKDSSEFLLGVMKDIDKSDRSAYLKYSGRLNDFLNLSFDVRYINSESYLDEHFRLTCEIKYYF